MVGMRVRKGEKSLEILLGSARKWYDTGRWEEEKKERSVGIVLLAAHILVLNSLFPLAVASQSARYRFQAPRAWVPSTPTQ